MRLCSSRRHHLASEIAVRGERTRTRKGPTNAEGYRRGGKKYSGATKGQWNFCEKGAVKSAWKRKNSTSVAQGTALIHCDVPRIASGEFSIDDSGFTTGVDNTMTTGYTSTTVEVAMTNFSSIRRIASPQTNPNVLKGNFDILLLNTCTLSCRHCCFLELPNRWSALPKRKFVWTFDELIRTLDHYSNNGIAFEELTLLGGEPTLHPRFVDIVKALQGRRGSLFRRLKIVSNMTNLDPEILLALASLDRVIFSLYEVNEPIAEALRNTGLVDWLRARTVVEFWRGDEFDVYGEPDPSFSGSYDQVSNYSRCPYKGGCRVISPSGVSYCHMAYAMGEDISSSNTDVLQEYLNRTTPLNACSVCPIPARREKWTSQDPARDRRSAVRALTLVKNSAAVLISHDIRSLES